MYGFDGALNYCNRTESMADDAASLLHPYSCNYLTASRLSSV